MFMQNRLDGVYIQLLCRTTLQGSGDSGVQRSTMQRRIQRLVAL